MIAYQVYQAVQGLRASGIRPNRIELGQRQWHAVLRAAGLPETTPPSGQLWGYDFIVFPFDDWFAVV